MSHGVKPPSAPRHAAVREYFSEHRRDWLDRYYSGSFDARNFQRRADVALEFLGGVPQGRGRLLEIGCGAGVQAAAAHRMGWTVSATDLTIPLLHQARGAFQGPSWVAAKAEELPFSGGTFDAVLMLGVIGYVSDPAAVLRVLRTVLAPGGYLIISWASVETLLGSASRVVSAIPDRLYLAAKRALRGPGASGDDNGTPSFYVSYNRFWPREVFTALLTGAGFSVLEARGVNFGQFRFMDRALWPERVDCVISAALEGVARVPGFGRLGHFTRTHVALARNPHGSV